MKQLFAWYCLGSGESSDCSDRRGSDGDGTSDRDSSSVSGKGSDPHSQRTELCEQPTQSKVPKESEGYPGQIFSEKQAR